MPRRRRPVLRGIDFQRANERRGTRFDDVTPTIIPPTPSTAGSLGGEIAKKRAASLISSIRRPDKRAFKVTSPISRSRTRVDTQVRAEG